MRVVLANLLWIGNARDARDVSAVLKQGIVAVADLGAEEPPVVYPRDIIVCRFPLLDGSGNAEGLIRTAVDCVANLIAGGLPTLVACSGGMSRSPVVAAAALASLRGQEIAESLAQITASGPCDISPGLWAEVTQTLRSPNL